MYNEDSMTYEETLKGIIDKDSINEKIILPQQRLDLDVHGTDQED